MAIKSIADIRRESGISLPKPKKTKTPAVYDPAKQVEGYRTRLEAAGATPNQLKGRNFLESALNLRENQPWWFDVFEIINRPQQTVFGGISAFQKGENIFEGAYQGLTGETFTTGKQLLQQTGIPFKDVTMEDLKPGESWLKSFNFVDVAGLALDVFLDPIDAALWGASVFTGGASAAVSIGLNAVQTASKATSTLKDIDNVVGAVKAINVVGLKKTIGAAVKSDLGKSMIKALDDMEKALTVGEFRKAVSTFEAIATTTRKISTLNLLFRTTTKAGATTLKFADNAVIKVLRSVDELALKSNPQLLKAFKKYGEAVLSVGLYDGIKNWVLNVFNAGAKMNAELWKKAKNFKSMNRLAKSETLAVVEDINKLVKNIAKDIGVPEEEAGRILKNIIEFEDGDVVYKLIDQLTDPETMQKLGLNLDNVNRIKDFLRKVVYSDGFRVFDEKTLDNLFRKTTIDGNDIFFIKYESQPTIKRKVDDFYKMVKSEATRVETTMMEIIRKNKIRPDEFLNLPISAYSDDFIKASASFDRLLEVAKELNTPFSAYKPLSAIGKADIDKYAKNAVVRDGIAKFKEKYLRMLATQDYYAKSKYATTMVREGGQTLLPKSLAEEGKELLSNLPSRSFKPKQIKGNVAVSAERIYPWGADTSNVMMKAMAKNMLDSGVKFSNKQILSLQQLASTNFFNEFLSSTLVDFITDKAPTSLTAQLIEDIAAVGTFSDPNVVKAYSGFIEGGKKVIDKTELINKINNLKLYRADDSILKKASNVLKRIKGNKLLVDEHVYDLLLLNNNPSTVGTLLNLYDQVNNLFKTTKLFRFAFHSINFFGNMFNMVMNGVNPIKAFSKSAEVYKMMTMGPELMERAFTAGATLDATGEVLRKVFTDPNELKMYQNLVEYVQSGLPQVSGMVFDIDEILEGLGKIPNDKKSLYQKVLQFNADLNERVDTMFRLTTFLYAKETPDILRRYNLSSAADLVRRIHFDPQDLSNFEKNVMRRIIPFYTFTKKNLVLQMKNLFQNTSNYNKLTKGMKGLWQLGDIEIGDLEEYKSTNFWLPLMVEKDGKYTALKANLPGGDLVDFLTDPLNKVMTSLSPFIRVPFEYASNTQFFTGLPIEQFPGQIGFRTKGSPLELPAAVEYGLSQTGIDTVLQTGFDVFNTVSRTGQRIMGMPVEETEKPVGIFQSALNRGSVQKTKTAQAYEELRRLQDMVSLFKQKEIKVPTIAEIEQKNTPYQAITEKLKSLRAKSR